MASVSEAPNVGRRQAIRLVVYAMLVLSAAASFLASDRVWLAAELGRISPWVPLVAPGLFTVFVVVFAVDRWLLVRRKAYLLSRAAAQMVLAVLFLFFLWPPQTSQYRNLRREGPKRASLARLFKHPNPQVRAAACDLVVLQLKAGISVDAPTRSLQKQLGTSDPIAWVQKACAGGLSASAY